MAEFENKDLLEISQQMESGLRHFQDTKKFDPIKHALSLIDFVSYFVTVSANDKTLIQKNAIDYLSNLHDKGLRDSDYFITIRTLCHTIDRMAKAGSDPDAYKFSELLAMQGLQSYLRLSYAKALEDGKDPASESFKELAAARIQTTGTMGKVFSRKYHETKEIGKITP